MNVKERVELYDARGFSAAQREHIEGAL